MIWLRRMLIAVALLLALLVGLMALAQYANYNPQTDTRNTVNFSNHPWAIVLHAVGASFAPLIGLLQWSTRLRRRWPLVHRWLGLVYLGIGVMIGGSAALWLSFFAYGGPTARAGLGIASVIWLYVSARAYMAIRDGDIRAHRVWMMRSLAMALGAVSLRVYLPALSAMGVPFLFAYRFVAWGSWVPNLLLAEWVITREGTITGLAATPHPLNTSAIATPGVEPETF